MNNGKGSAQRPRRISDQQWSDNYDRAFKKVKEPEEKKDKYGKPVRK